MWLVSHVRGTSVPEVALSWSFWGRQGGFSEFLTGKMRLARMLCRIEVSSSSSFRPSKTLPRTPADPTIVTASDGSCLGDRGVGRRGQVLVATVATLTVEHLLGRVYVAALLSVSVSTRAVPVDKLTHGKCQLHGPQPPPGPWGLR